MLSEVTLDELVERARGLVMPGERRILGIVGEPGGGKSTLAKAVVERLSPYAANVPMDGFHLANTELERLGRSSRKGAPDTFDAAGYAALLRRLRSASEEVVYAPEYRREIEESIGGAIAVPQDVPLIVTEGNYLLLEQDDWSEVPGLLDEVWYVDMDQATRLEWLIRRHIAFGKDPAAARAFALGNDQRNADLITATRDRADLVVRVEDLPSPVASSDDCNVPAGASVGQACLSHPLTESTRAQSSLP